MAAQMIQVSPKLQLLVARSSEGDARESGWWVMRSFNRETLQWRDYPLPGRGITLWIPPRIARKFGLN